MAALHNREYGRSSGYRRHESDPLFVPRQTWKIDLGSRTPAIVIPTATSTQLGQGKLSFGPSVVALVQPGHWTFGVLVNNVFSVAGSSHRPSVNQMTLQYFITYNLKKGWNINSSRSSLPTGTTRQAATRPTGTTPPQEEGGRYPTVAESDVSLAWEPSR